MSDRDADVCRHADIRFGGYHGPRLPLRYGSAEVLICADCGVWRVWRDAREKSNSRWRAPAELLIAIARSNDE